MASDARKVRKVTRACDACKAKKKACTGTLPCGPCAQRRMPCTYNAAYNRGVAVSPLSSGHQIKRPSSASSNADINQPQTIGRSRYQHYAIESPSESWVQPPSAHISPAPAFARTASGTPADPPNESESSNIAPQYWGPTSAHSFLGRVVQDLPSTPSKTLAQQRERGTSSSVSIFSFGDRVTPNGLAEFEWPGRRTADILVRRYFDFASPTYRVLHQPTVELLVHDLFRGGNVARETSLPTATRATLLLIFSIATMFQPDSEGHITDADTSGWQTSETYYTQADALLSHETGAPSLASVQARFLMVLYLLSSSRAHKAWFTFGTTVQLMMALGYHSKRPRLGTDEEDLIQKECQRRVLWCSYTLDKYLSVILGRPRLWQDEDLDEDLPDRINDQDLSRHEKRMSKRDCLMDAPVFHTMLARILTQAAKEPYVVTGVSTKAQIDIIRLFCGRVAEWQAELPAFLSGIIQPDSLVPGLRRQLTVLQLARYHALLFITRPLLLRNYGQTWPECEASCQYYLSLCLTAARDAIELILTFVQEKQLFQSFWYSQYIAFNALSIIYLYLIQVQRGRISPVNLRFVSSQDVPFDSPLDESTLYRLSETAQAHLADATVRNAPPWRYSIILQGLRRELTKSYPSAPSHTDIYPDNHSSQHGATADRDISPSTAHQRDMIAFAQAEQNGSAMQEILSTQEDDGAGGVSGLDNDAQLFLLDPQTEILLDNLATDEDLVLDFWPQFDSLPISYLG
ncbi:uncharacterized protein N7446_001462 [Penicillium canescens]|uniref:Zn(2)-C6 fungal-type domain-containing protein n=1 Tax=Penicillium canescens TaxID=5083 RepID=A0AAD6ICS4_PENCN|nr:uncharacterized protein N7446_001462 [Penicillium canescens]KAJ6043266.1 hypothetical protein N7460_004621 [Penicillium canescens]KAJ6073685.1 hypothetical protein N7446_001462 [Penicillium canescens]